MLPFLSPLPWETGHTQIQPLLLKISKLYQSTTLLQTSSSFHAALTSRGAYFGLPRYPPTIPAEPETVTELIFLVHQFCYVALSLTHSLAFQLLPQPLKLVALMFMGLYTQLCHQPVFRNSQLSVPSLPPLKRRCQAAAIASSPHLLLYVTFHVPC